MINGFVIGLIIGMTIFEVLGQIFIKTYHDTKAVYWFFLGWFLYGFVLFFLYLTYYQTSFAIANSIWSAAAIVGTTVVGIFYFKEELSMMEIVGIATIILGVIIVGMFETDTATKLE